MGSTPFTALRKWLSTECTCGVKSESTHVGVLISIMLLDCCRCIEHGLITKQACRIQAEGALYVRGPQGQGFCDEATVDVSFLKGVEVVSKGRKTDHKEGKTATRRHRVAAEGCKMTTER